MIREVWRATSRPRPFFEQLAATESRLPRSLLAAILSVSVALLVAGVALLRLTDSDAPVPLLGTVLALGLVNWGLVWGFGGIVLMRPAQLDVRAWELLAWSWTPAGVTAASLLPAAFIAPLPALVLGYLGALIWHLLLLNVGLRAFSAARARQALLWYLVLVVVLPWTFFALLFALLLPTAQL